MNEGDMKNEEDLRNEEDIKLKTVLVSAYTTRVLLVVNLLEQCQ